MKLNKGDTYILNNLLSHKVISIVMMICGAFGIIYGSYLIIFKEERGINVALAGASLVVLGSNFLSFCYINILEQFKKAIDNSKYQAKTVCPKCSFEFTIEEKIVNKTKSVSLKNSKESKSRFSFIMELPFLIALLGFLTSFFLWLLFRR
jgi:hypothetical protein